MFHAGVNGFGEGTFLLNHSRTIGKLAGSCILKPVLCRLHTVEGDFLRAAPAFHFYCETVSLVGHENLWRQPLTAGGPMADEALQTLENSMQHIIDEMFQNGHEEGCRIWDDYSHPLQQAVAILFRAQVEVKYPHYMKEAAHLEV